MWQNRKTPRHAYFKIVQARTRGGGGLLGARAPPPPPHQGKKFRSEMSKRGEKVLPRCIGKKECARSAQGPCIVGQQHPTLLGPTMLWLVASVCMDGTTTVLALVGTCCVQPVKLLAQQVPTFLLFCDQRSVAQQCCVCLHGTATMWPNIGLVKTSAHAPCNIFFKKQTIVARFVVNMAYQAKLNE